MEQTIKVSGRGISSGVADKSIVTISATTVAKTATEARDKHSKVSQQINKALLGLGIDGKDLQSSEFSFGESYAKSRDYSERVRNGFYCKNSMRVKIRDLKKVTMLLDVAVSAGATEISGPNLTIDNPLELEDQSRTKAFRAAKAKAEIYCQAAGLILGHPISMEETTDYNSRVAGGGGKMAASYGDDDEELQVGTIDIAVSLDVVFSVTPRPQEIARIGQSQTSKA